MNRNELNSNWIQTILYYCFIVGSGAMFDLYGYGIGSYGYDENSNLIITTWLLTTINEPTINDLLSYTISDVTTFYTNYYLNPTLIINTQPFFKISTADLQLIPLSLCVKGYGVYDTTTQNIKIYNGTEWVNF